MVCRAVVIRQFDEGRIIVFLLADNGFERLVAFHVQALVGVPVLGVRPLDPIEGMSRFLPGFDVLAVPIPEIPRQFPGATVEQADASST